MEPVWAPELTEAVVRLESPFSSHQQRAGQDAEVPRCLRARAQLFTKAEAVFLLCSPGSGDLPGMTFFNNGEKCIAQSKQQQQQQKNLPRLHECQVWIILVNKDL